MGSIWEQKKCLGLGQDLSKEVLWVSVDQRVAKLQAVKVGGFSDCPEIESGPHSCGSTRAGGKPS